MDTSITRSFKLHYKNGKLVFKIYKGSITKANVEAIISVLDSGKSGGISAAILREAGDSVVSEIKDNKYRKVTENVITKAGKLPCCKYIIHCACPRWENWQDSRGKTKCLNDLCSTVKKALEAACVKGIKSVGLPPIGLGVHFGIPKLACVAMYVKSITEFVQFLPGMKTPIREIHFVDKTDDLVQLAIDTYDLAVINPEYLVEKHVLERLEDLSKNETQSQYQRDFPVPQKFVPGEQQYQNPYSPSSPHLLPAAEQHCPTKPDSQLHSFVYPQKSPYRKYIGPNGEAEHFEMNKLRVLIYTDDLTNVNNVDILASTENIQNPGMGVLSQAILTKAGDRYKKEHAKLFVANKKKNTTGILCTTGGQLSYKGVLHVIIDKFPNTSPPKYHLHQLRSVIYDLLKKANEQKVKKKPALSVALPLIGTGSITNSTYLAQYASAMLEGLEYFSSTKTVNLQTVHVVNFAEATTKVIVEVFKSSCSNLSSHTDQQNQNRYRHQQHQKQSDETKKKSGKETHKFNPRQYKMVDSWKSVVQQKQNLNPYLVPISPKTALLEEHSNCNTAPLSESKSGQGNLIMIDSDSEDSDTGLPEPADCEQPQDGACAVVPDDNEAMCVICMDDVLTDPVQLKDCKHEFCRECIVEYLSHKSACPVCNTLYGEMFGNQPENGTAKIYEDDASLPGTRCGTLIIHYEFPDGYQSDDHPSPGEPYRGISRQGYLPDNKEGRRILRMLKRAFEQRLIFTVGFSRTSGRENVTWNDIYHKTRREGGPEKYGYPDPDYLSRVEDELYAKGISEK